MDCVIKRAAAFAKVAHENAKQFRKYTGEPYIVHPAEVAQIVRGITDDKSMIAAAWLHDTVEDTTVTLANIEAEFGQDIRDLVFCLTDISKPEEGNRAARKKIDREHNATGPSRAQTIKVADLISNSKSIIQHDLKFAKVYIPEKEATLKLVTKAHITLRKEAWRVIDSFKALEF